MISPFRRIAGPALVLGLLIAPGARPGHAADPGTARPKGSLDKELIARVVRQHLPEVKACYQRELGDRPALEGRVVVRFTVGSEGQVLSSVLETSTLGVPRAENCIVKAVEGWQFPRPTGGEVLVSYPFVLAPR